MRREYKWYTRKKHQLNTKDGSNEMIEEQNRCIRYTENNKMAEVLVYQ